MQYPGKWIHDDVTPMGRVSLTPGEERQEKKKAIDGNKAVVSFQGMPRGFFLSLLLLKNDRLLWAPYCAVDMARTKHSPT